MPQSSINVQVYIMIVHAINFSVAWCLW